jgi:hypothetical protein
MKRYETDDDRWFQMEAVARLTGAFPDHVRIRETEKDDAMPHDAEIFLGDTMIAVGEIKCRKYSFSYMAEHDGWLLEVERLSRLKQVFYKNGIEVYMVLRTSDPRFFFITMSQLMLGRCKLKKVEGHMMTDDHGKRKCDKSGLLVPVDLLVEM